MGVCSYPLPESGGNNFRSFLSLYLSHFVLPCSGASGTKGVDRIDMDSLHPRCSELAEEVNWEPPGVPGENKCASHPKCQELNSLGLARWVVIPEELVSNKGTED